MRLPLTLLSLLMLAGCDGDEVSLSVDLKTDFVSGVEFIAVRTTVDGVSDDSAATTGRDFLDGDRVAELGRFAPGDRDVQVALLDASGAEIARRRVLLRHDIDYALTVTITRDCRDVTCPGSGDPASATTCVAGTCADPACSELDPLACPDAECSAPSECPMAAACASARCDDGACIYGPVGGACGADEYCDVEFGCRSRPDIPDAGGPIDAGGPTDAGGLDAGPPDAGAPAGLIALSVAAGGGHTCAVLPSMEVACWGENSSRQGSFSGPTDRPVPEITPLGPAVEVQAYFAHTCVRRMAGAVECFGRGDAFQLGVDISPALFTEVPQDPGLPGVTRLWPGSFSCAQRGMLTHCWGSNTTGQLGLGFVSPMELPGAMVDAPVPLEQVAQGGGHACAAGGGAVYCWGAGGSGELGNGGTADEVVLQVAGGIGGADYRVAAGSDHSCAGNPSEVYCWGNNGDGQLGTADPSPVTSPALVPGLGADELCAGERYTCARRGGEVLCFGRNTDGQLGRGAISPFERTAAPVVGLSDAAGISCGKLHVCALRATGQVVCWGLGSAGQLGDGMAMGSPTPVLVRAP